jgi:hypothetical protein
LRKGKDGWFWGVDNVGANSPTTMFIFLFEKAPDKSGDFLGIGKEMA